MTELQWVGTERPSGRSPQVRKPVEGFIEQLRTRPGVWAVWKQLPAGKRWAGYHKYRRRYPGTDWATETTANVTTVFVVWTGECERDAND